MKLKDIAHRACYQVATDIKESPCMADLLLPRIDRVEKRFNCIGATDAYLLALQREEAQYIYNLQRQHDACYPDRLSYLHR